MFKISTTTVIPSGPTTERWYGRDFLDYYYYYDGGPFPNWEVDTDLVFEKRTQELIVEKSKDVDYGASFVGFFLNLIHLLILTRKELRNNVVFIIMIGICICDLLVSSCNIIHKTYEKVDSSTCGTNEQWWFVFIELIALAVQKFGRLNSAILALTMAGIRAVTVMFPMNKVSDSLMKPSYGLRISIFESLVCVIWYILSYSSYIIYKGTGFREGREFVWEDSCYFAADKGNGLNDYIEGIFVFLLTAVYLITTATLLITLKLAQKSRKNLKSDKLVSL
ncbi:hypothetical protein GCK72_019688 [Caenorhabditis remanei]|uniref:G-protein coupled receptors family 1 profile domain-containing protein n=1 Tax=Caenorhabditis remanei TaxID=31234 RepID=A0A6A5GF65_CAERE|nr:hypothetical protein GCK72_019688 [Caenorhabditis remanei]KAF1753132.1 hypothetical protein GCK72_019688 [Caenorhabditis remanei]